MVGASLHVVPGELDGSEKSSAMTLASVVFLDLDIDEYRVFIGNDPGAANDSTPVVSQDPPVLVVASDACWAFAELLELTHQRHGWPPIQPLIDLRRDAERWIRLKGRTLQVGIITRSQFGIRMSCPRESENALHSQSSPAMTGHLSTLFRIGQGARRHGRGWR
jgi:hypothetical protein